MEILWPLILFLILVAVRTRGLRKFNHQCHFDEKIMPSAGLLPYAQSLVCSFNNTCHKHEQRDFTQLSGYNSSMLTQMLEDTQRILSLNIDEEGEKTLEIISQDFVTLRTIWNKVRQRPPSETVSGKALTVFLARLNISRTPAIGISNTSLILEAHWGQ